MTDIDYKTMYEQKCLEVEAMTATLQSNKELLVEAKQRVVEFQKHFTDLLDKTAEFRNEIDALRQAQKQLIREYPDAKGRLPQLED